MSFQNLDDYQRAKLVELLDAIATKEYSEEFLAVTHKDGGAFVLVGVHGRSDKNIQFDPAALPIAVLARRGYLEGYGEHYSPTEKAWQEYQKLKTESLPRAATTQAEWDVFICHATEDKASFVQGLAEALRNERLRVWYDTFTLTLGDSLRRKIDEGLAKSEYGIVVLSHHFFGKNWPQAELDGLASKEISGKKVILPVWHEIDIEEVRNYSPTLAGRVAAKSKDGMAKVLQEILRVLRPDSISSPSPQPARAVDNPDWSKSLADYTTNYVQRTNNAGSLMPPRAFLSISNVLPHIADVSVDTFRAMLREKRLQISNVAIEGGWPYMYGFPEGKTPDWQKDRTVISIDARNFWDFRLTGSFLFCSNLLCWIETSKEDIGIRTLLISLLRNLTFGAVLADALKVRGTGGVTFTLHNIRHFRLILEPDNTFQSDFPRCVEDRPRITMNFDYRLSKRHIAETAVAFMNELFLSFPNEYDGSRFLRGDLTLIRSAAEKQQAIGYLNQYYKEA